MAGSADETVAGRVAGTSAPGGAGDRTGAGEVGEVQEIQERARRFMVCSYRNAKKYTRYDIGTNTMTTMTLMRTRRGRPR